MAKKKKTTKGKSSTELPFSLDSLPDPQMMKQLIRQFVGMLDNESPRETLKESPLDRAQDLAYQAMESAPAKQVQLAKRALAISSDCADAYVLLAENATTVEEAMTQYKHGVEAGERALGKKAFKEYAGNFWGFIETRPYMRAKEGLAECLWKLGRREEAAEHFQDMLKLNPNDNQGVRYRLATLLLDLDHDDALHQLWADYETDECAVWAYTAVLAVFRREGESSLAEKLLRMATKVNKHVPAYLLGTKPLPQDLPPYISPGEEDEAIAYAADNRRVWLNTPGAISWLRKTIKVPMSKASKARRSSWAQVQSKLQACPQAMDAIWQIDVVPIPVSEQDAADEPVWIAVIVDRVGQKMLGIEHFNSKPTPTNVLSYVADIMRRPLDADSHRPASIEVRQKAFWTAWKTKLKQIDVDCILSNSLNMVDAVLAQMPSNDDGLAASEVRPEDLLLTPIEPGEVWQAELRAMPAWITDEDGPYRPWMALVVSRSHDLVLGHDISQKCPSAEWLGHAIGKVIQRPAVGDSRRPSRVEVRSVEQRDAILSYLQQAGIECEVVSQLDVLDAAFDSMLDHLNRDGGPPSLLNAPRITLEQVGGFFAAAAEFYRQKPWQRVPGDTIIQVDCDKFQSGTWYAVVMGQSGVQQGIALYENLAALQSVIAGHRSEAENARGMSAISMMFSEVFELSFRDLDAAEKYGWQVAGPEAYPMVLRINPGCAVRSPLVWELELVEGCLRTIPDFLAEKAESLTKTVTIASETLAFRLSKVPE
jgi:tetratricopeptide (TPR) repeat protein